MKVCISNSYTTVCPPVRGDNPRVLASARITVSHVHVIRAFSDFKAFLYILLGGFS